MIRYRARMGTKEKTDIIEIEGTASNLIEAINNAQSALIKELDICFDRNINDWEICSIAVFREGFKK